MEMRMIKITICLLVLFVINTGIVFSQTPLSLSQAISTALENNYNITIIEKNVEVAKLNNNWANTGAMPSIDLQGTGSYNGTYSDSPTQLVGNGTASLGLSWLLFDGRGMRIRKNKFEYYEELSQGNSAVVVETTIQSVIASYYFALLQKEVLSMYKYIRDLSKDRYDYEQRKQELGTSVTYDVLQAQNAYLQDESDFLNQQVAYHDALRNLNYIMAVPTGTQYDLTDEFIVTSDEYDLKNLREKMLSNNSNLQNQYISQKLLQADIQAARSEWFPKLSLGAGVNANATSRTVGELAAVNTTSRGFYSNLNLSFNIFDGGTKKRSLQIAKIQEEIGTIEIKEMKHSLENQLASLYEYYDVRKQILDVSNEAIKAAKLNLEISEQKFKNGTLNSFNYRDVQTMYLSTAINNLNAIYNLIDSKVQLMRISGGIISEYNPE